MKGNLKAMYPFEQSKLTYQQEIEKLCTQGIKYFRSHMEHLKEVAWIYDENPKEGIYYPSIADSFSLYVGMSFILGEKSSEEGYLVRFLSKEHTDYVRALLMMSIECSNKIRQLKAKNVKEEQINQEIKCYKDKANQTIEKYSKTGKFALIKGSIYKIKRYFLENNDINDIRGGSAIIDHINIECVRNYLTNEENGLIKECLIYSGGGNILLMAPNGQGKRICQELEEKFEEIALTAMHAFVAKEEMELVDLLFNFKEVTRDLNDLLKDREKTKIYNFEPEPSMIENLNIDGERIRLKNKREISGKVCPLCAIREAYYSLEVADEGKQMACPSCYRKHVVGKEGKHKFHDEYNNFYEGKANVKAVNILDEMKDSNGMIAVLYGDGNNMGNIVMHINAPYEMMYFSYKTEKITKASVYTGIKSILGLEAKFEVLAIGGDDLFFIVPAEFAPALAVEVTKNFDQAFDHQVTMSIGICIGKYNTPIKAMFEIAQTNLKNAKKTARKQAENKQKTSKDKQELEGTIDILELNSGQTILKNDEDKRMFPLEVSILEKALKTVQGMGDNKHRIYDYSYAHTIMEDEEFRLYFNYKEAKAKTSGKPTMTSYLNQIIGDSVTVYLQDVVPWDDLLLLIKYGRGI